MKLPSYAQGQWVEPAGAGVDLFHAATGEKVAECSSEGLDFKQILDYGRRVGGPALRRLTFHQRALLLKEMAKHLLGNKDQLYSISPWTGATKADSWLDIDGGITTLFVYSSKARKELPDQAFLAEGEMENLSRDGSFVGQHICTPLEGAAVHINAFNFPCWALLEKLAPGFLAGVPSIVKPATTTAFLAQRLVDLMISSKIFPEGSLQLICGSVGDLFDHLGEQDIVSFTGSADTGRRLRSHPRILQQSIRFNMEADSLNACLLGPDVCPGEPEFDSFLDEVAREITVKAGQKCTAIRRILVPQGREQEVLEALGRRLAALPVGDPTRKDVKMGPLVSRDQVAEVLARVEDLRQESELIRGQSEDFEVIGADRRKGAFLPPFLLYCAEPLRSSAVHQVEAFGPVSTLMPYRDTGEAIELVRRGRGSLVASLFTRDDGVAAEVVAGIAPYHGRLLVLDRESVKASTGHGSPLPHLVHGGPGRAGGGEELGGIRAVLKYMQRTALQGGPGRLSRVCGTWMPGAQRTPTSVHPFRKHFEELNIGDSLTTHRRTVTETDIVNFAGLSGDYFYVHMDEPAARESIFGRRVAHGYLVLSLAAGLFVDPAPGPVLANYGLDGLRFTLPVHAGDTLQVHLTCSSKSAKDDRQGIVGWDVEVVNQDRQTVARYQLLTLVKRLPAAELQEPQGE